MDLKDQRIDQGVDVDYGGFPSPFGVMDLKVPGWWAHLAHHRSEFPSPFGVMDLKVALIFGV